MHLRPSPARVKCHQFQARNLVSKSKIYLYPFILCLKSLNILFTFVLVRVFVYWLFAPSMAAIIASVFDWPLTALCQLRRVGDEFYIHCCLDNRCTGSVRESIAAVKESIVSLRNLLLGLRIYCSDAGPHSSIQWAVYFHRSFAVQSTPDSF